MREGGKWTLLSLDPSINDCGFAGWNGGALQDYGLLHPPRALRDWRLKAACIRDSVLSLVRAHDPLFVVVESPETIYESGPGTGRHGTGDGTLKLAYLVGSLASSVHTAPAQPRFLLEVTPERWKGRSPKVATLRAVNANLGLDLKNEKRHLDIADAIGVGHWFIRAATPAMLGAGLHAPCSRERMALVARALNQQGWRH